MGRRCRPLVYSNACTPARLHGVPDVADRLEPASAATPPPVATHQGEGARLITTAPISAQCLLCPRTREHKGPGQAKRGA